jgi:hypothetical protein
MDPIVIALKSPSRGADTWGRITNEAMRHYVLTCDLQHPKGKGRRSEGSDVPTLTSTGSVWSRTWLARYVLPRIFKS